MTEMEKIENDLTNQRSKAFNEHQKNHPGTNLTIAQLNEYFVSKKLAEFEYRLRKLEAASGSAQSYLDMHTPLI